jgi:hypothetical protein
VRGKQIIPTRIDKLNFVAIRNTPAIMNKCPTVAKTPLPQQVKLSPLVDRTEVSLESLAINL